ncbi:SRPBCC family protein [Pseudonocardia pini]|uniref:SRPBCC family protein n=1 Tax=Pseudonocardia pini TaxID=2758030 RepID=UPI0015F075C2|nr:SRPBCC domain-containing protein [Pseudonocardia pini]
MKGDLTAAVTVDQFVAAPPATVWRALTDPEQIGRWWASGDVKAEVGHEFTLAMPGFGDVSCVVTEVVSQERFVYTFNGDWTLAPEGRGTRLILEHSGFDLDDTRGRGAFDRMGPGWRDEVLPRLAALAEEMDRGDGTVTPWT